MSPREKRLAKLVAVHGELRRLHEGRRSGFLAAAAQAREEAEALVARFDAPGSMAGLFPELYHARTAAAQRREADHAALAAEEAQTIARLDAREKRVREALSEEARRAERGSAERSLLDWLETVNRRSGRHG